MTVTLYAGGTPRPVKLTDADARTVRSLLGALLLKTSETLKVRVDRERIEEQQKTEQGAEFVFPHEVVFRSETFGEIAVQRLYLPFTGDYVGTTRDPVITVFAGDTTYFTGPFRNPTGYPQLQELRRILERSAGQ